MAKLSTLKNSVNPLTWNVSITNPDGTPNDEFMRKWAQQAKTNAAIPDLTTAAGMSARLDLLGSTPGMLLERGATYWAGLASPANAAKFLNGANFPAYAFVKDSDLALTDITTNNVTNLKHGFAPKSPADVTTFLNGGASPAYAQVKDSDLALTDITTNNVTIAAHGFAPKAPNDISKFLDGTGNWSIPAGGGGGSSGAASIQDDGTNVYIALSDTDGQLVLDGLGDPIFSLEVFPAASLANAPSTLAGYVTGGFLTNIVNKVKGFITGALPAAGDEGELKEATLLVGGAISCTSGINQDIVFIDLTPGFWRVWGSVSADVDAGTSTSVFVGWINTASATEPVKPNFGAHLRQLATLATGDGPTYPIGMRYYNITVNTRIYLTARFGFTGGALRVYGYMGAIRG